MKIVIRADSSTHIGTGHVMRCLSLAEALREQGAQVAFISRDLPGNISDQIAELGFDLHRLVGSVPDAETDASLTRAVLAEGTWDWLIVDHYDLDANWERRLRDVAGRIMVIDDLANRPHDCDLLLDQNLSDQPFNRYQGLLPMFARLLLGPENALLRKQFGRTARVRVREEIQRILLFFGGADAGNETGKALDACVALGRPDITVDVLVGSANPNAEELRTRLAQHSNANFLTGVTNLEALMTHADLAIGAGGTSSWERCRMGLPCITIAIADNQVGPSVALAQAGCIEYLGESRHVTSSDIRDAITRLTSSPSSLRSMSERSRDLVDGLGAERVVRTLLSPFIVLRTATIADCERIHQWRNHESTRRFFRDPNPVAFEDHKRWYTAALADSGRTILIGMHGENPVGVIRFDFDGQDATVSIYLVPGLSGQGYGTALLRSGTEWIQRNKPETRHLHAEILPENKASRAAFARAGYAGSENHFEMSIR